MIAEGRDRRAAKGLEIGPFPAAEITPGSRRTQNNASGHRCSRHDLVGCPKRLMVFAALRHYPLHGWRPGSGPPWPAPGAADFDSHSEGDSSRIGRPEALDRGCDGALVEAGSPHFGA